MLTAPVVISGITFALVLCGFAAGLLWSAPTDTFNRWLRHILFIFIGASVLVTVVGASGFGQLIVGAPTAIVIGWLLNGRRPDRELRSSQTKFVSGASYIVFVALTVCLAVFLRSVNLGEFGLRLDEMYQFRTGIGWLQTGDFVQWDFVNNRPSSSYHRAWISTWVIAQAMNFLGVTLHAARVPSIVFGTLLFVPFLGILRRLNLVRWQKLLCLLLLAISPFVITISRWIRMYSFFLLVFLTLVWVVIWFLQTKSTSVKIGLFTVALILAGFSFHLHLLTLSVAPAVAVFLLWEWARDFHSMDGKWRDGRLFTTVALLIGGSVVFYLIYGRIDEFVGFGGQIYPMYVVYLSQELLGFLLGGLFLAVSLILYRRTRSERCLLSVLLVPVVLMTIFSGRFPQIRYTGFLIPLAIPVFVQSGTRLFESLWSDRSWYLTVAVLGVFLLVPARDLPSKLQYIWNGNMGYVSFSRIHSARFEDVTNWLIQRKPLEARVILCEASGYYVSRLREHGIDARGVTEKRRLTLEDVRGLEDTADSVMWIMPSETLVCMEREALEHVKNNYRRQPVPRTFYVDAYLLRG